MIIRHFVLPTKGFHTFVFAVLRCFTIRQEILIVGALSVHSDGVAPVHNRQHVLPVGHGVWHQDLFHKASMGASKTTHTEILEECSSAASLPAVVEYCYPHLVTGLSLRSAILLQGDRVGQFGVKRVAMPAAWLWPVEQGKRRNKGQDYLLRTGEVRARRVRQERRSRWRGRRFMAHCYQCSASPQLLLNRACPPRLPFLVGINSDKATQDITFCRACITISRSLSNDEAYSSPVSCQSRMMPFAALE